MKGNRIAWVSMSLLALLVVHALLAQPASAQGDDISIVDSIVFIVQGENDISNGSEDVDDFYALRIVNYTLPRDSSRIHMNVPGDAKDLFVMASGEVLGSGSYGWEDDGSGKDVFFIEVPSTHTRTNYFALLIDNETEFLSNGSQLYNTSYASGALQLVDGALDGYYISDPASVTGAVSVLSANVTLWGESLENVTIQVSNNNGTDWLPCENATRTDFVSVGTELLMRFDFTGNASIQRCSMSSEYTALFTYLDVHVSYVWTQRFENGVATVELTDLYDYEAGASCFLMMYVLNGYGVSGENITLSTSESGTTSSYPDKVLFINESFRPDPHAHTVVRVIAPQTQSSYALYYLAAVIGAMMVGAIAYARYGKRRRTMQEDGDGGIEEQRMPEEIPVVDFNARRKELVERKKVLLAEMDNARKQLSAGEISQEEAGEKLAGAKKEFKAIRNELNKLPRMDEASEQLPPKRPSLDYEALLAAIARIDEDHERGRLSDDSHKKLRKEYVSRAAKMVAEKRASQSVEEAEKAKLTEALETLDEEHERREIPDDIYTDLRESYKRQLADLMKESEGSKGEE